MSGERLDRLLYSIITMAVEFKDYYKILGVDRKADDKTIKSAYRKLARKHHPDVAKGKDNEERFKEINEAYEVLSDPDKRQRYDSLGPDWQRYATQRLPVGRAAGFVSSTERRRRRRLLGLLPHDLRGPRRAGGGRAGRSGGASTSRISSAADAGGRRWRTRRRRPGRASRSLWKKLTVAYARPSTPRDRRAVPDVPRLRARRRQAVQHLPRGRLATGRRERRREDSGRREDGPTRPRRGEGAGARGGAAIST